MILELLREAKEKIAERDAVWLLSVLLGKSRGEILMDRAQSIPNRSAKIFRLWIRERADGKPLQYIAGLADFYGRAFRVDKRVLIPRPETEGLVELALAEGDAIQSGLERPLRAVDVGTGSGAIAVTLKLERPDWEVAAGDVSAAALGLAQVNADAHGAYVDFRRSDLLGAWWEGGASFDLVVANLPYIWKGKEWVEPQVAKWEPEVALYPKRDKRSRLRNIGAHLAERMVADCLEEPRGIRGLVLELSATVAYDLERRFHKDPRIASLSRRADLAGRRRFLVIRLGT